MFRFNNILSKLLLQYSMKENIYKRYFIARIVLKWPINIMKCDSEGMLTFYIGFYIDFSIDFYSLFLLGPTVTRIVIH
jgi:hypothetical protein